jgi:hypothetical protein
LALSIEHEQALDLDDEKEEDEKTNSMAVAARHKTFRKANGATGRENGERACYGCGKPGHIKKRCRTTVPECYKCGEQGHLERECKKESSEGKAFKSTLAFTVLDDEEKSTDWILESGSLVHVCNSRGMFKSLQMTDGGDQKLFGIAGRVNVAGWGEVLI